MQGPGQLQVDRDRPGRVPDGQVPGQPVGVVVRGPRPWCSRRRWRGIAPRRRSRRCAGGRRGRGGPSRSSPPRGDLGARAGGVLGVQVQRALEILERAAHFGDHGVAGHEADPAVGGVEGVVPCQGLRSGAMVVMWVSLDKCLHMQLYTCRQRERNEESNRRGHGAAKAHEGDRPGPARPEARSGPGGPSPGPSSSCPGCSRLSSMSAMGDMTEYFVLVNLSEAPDRRFG